LTPTPAERGTWVRGRTRCRPASGRSRCRSACSPARREGPRRHRRPARQSGVATLPGRSVMSVLNASCPAGSCPIVLCAQSVGGGVRSPRWRSSWCSFPGGPAAWRPFDACSEKLLRDRAFRLFQALCLALTAVVGRHIPRVDRGPELVPREPRISPLHRTARQGHGGDLMPDDGGVVHRGPVPGRGADDPVRAVRYRFVAVTNG